jgi:hypothetical protein
MGLLSRERRAASMPRPFGPFRKGLRCSVQHEGIESQNPRAKICGFGVWLLTYTPFDAAEHHSLHWIE